MRVFEKRLCEQNTEKAFGKSSLGSRNHSAAETASVSPLAGS